MSYVQCQTCSGNGLPLPITKVCPSCLGLGKMMKLGSNKFFFPCEECDGKGILINNSMSCTPCAKTLQLKEA
jgi:DnaJ-class molecular chaperone